MAVFLFLSVSLLVTQQHLCALLRPQLSGGKRRIKGGGFVEKGNSPNHKSQQGPKFLLDSYP